MRLDWILLPDFGFNLPRIRNYLGGSVIEFSLALLILGLVVSAISEPNRRLDLLRPIFLFFGFWLYIVFLMTAYFIRFTEYEGTRLASFERYVGTYLVAYVILESAAVTASINIPKSFLSRFKVAPQWNRRYSGAVLGLIVVLLFYQGQGLVRESKDALAIRDTVEISVQQLQNRAKVTDRVYFLHPNTTGFTFYIAQYLTSNPMNPYCWSLGEPYSKGDVWTCNVPIQTAIRQYDWLIVQQPDPTLEALLSGLIQGNKTLDKSTNLFKIEHWPTYHNSAVLVKVAGS